MNDSQAERLLDVQQKIISLMSLGTSLNECLECIAIEIEHLIEESDAYCSILLLDGDVLRHGAAPSLDDAYCAAIDGTKIGPNVGSCGSAAFKVEDVFVTSIATDPLWDDYKELALAHGLRACWSVPVISSYGRVLGTFAIYFGHERKVNVACTRLLKRFCALASLAMEREINESQARLLQKALQHNSHRFESFARAMPDLVIVFDELGNYVDIYGAQMSSLILPLNLLKGQNMADVLPPAKSSAMLRVIKQSLQENSQVMYEYELDVQSGHRCFEARVSPILNYSPDAPNLQHVIWIAQDVTEQRKADDTIRKLSFYDAITSLPNRSLLKERLAQQVRRAHKHKMYGAVLYLDLNDFRRVNDAVGVAGGDQLIVEVAKRIGNCIEHRDSLARVGGDDFVVLVDGMGKNLPRFSNEITSKATRILSVFEERFKVLDRKFRVSARVGINIFGRENVSPEMLINQAESAMHRAKELGERVVFFDTDIQQSLVARLHMEYDLERALRNEEISVFYQPQVDASGTVCGFEALMRWEHAERGFISPLEFIPLAEQLGIISDLQVLVLRNVCSFVRVLERSDRIAQDFRVAVNISACQFTKDDFEVTLLSTLDSFLVSPERITIEITESTLLDDVDLAIVQMRRLQSLGFDLSIDDFGTGYSSLAYLKNLPANEIKIDKSFVDDVCYSNTAKSIVDVIIYLAKHLQCRIVAEGVELEAQKRYLDEQGVDLVQGYFIAKPMSVEDTLLWCEQQGVSESMAQAKRA